MNRCVLFLTIVGAAAWGSIACAQAPSVTGALQLKPMQADVDYDRPGKSELDNCRISPEDSNGETAWVVHGLAGETLRRFVDSNDDKKVDQWRYYKAGVEVYRDIDADFNGKADQYRWLGTEGTRWGLDENEDGKIDSWKSISAEEVTAQVIEAIKLKDVQRFQNVLLDSRELRTLGLGKRISQTISNRIELATRNFDRIAVAQKKIGRDTQWIDFGGLRPGTIPTGTDGSTRDVTVYENIIAMVETDGRPAQVPIGTMVKTSHGWRVVDLAIASDDTTSPQFVFFEAASQPSQADSLGIDEETRELVESLQKVDTGLSNTQNARSLAKLNEQRADILERLAKASSRTADRDMWWMQFADTVGAASQSGAYPKGTARLEDLRTRLEATSENTELLAHVTFAHMSADYAQQLNEEDVDYAKVQDSWLVRLESFIKKYPKSGDAPEAMLQLALAKEFESEIDDANRWYTSIVRDFSDSPLATKAAGAKRRLESVGKTMTLQGRTVEGKAFDLRRLQGSVVLVHYWATWCEPCKQDMEVLAKLKKELRGQKFEIVGVNVDSSGADVAKFFRSNKRSWTHLYEKGGLDGRLASEMGIFTLPVMLLVDERGRVVNRQIHTAQLEKEIEKLLR